MVQKQKKKKNHYSLSHMLQPWWQSILTLFCFNLPTLQTAHLLSPFAPVPRCLTWSCPSPSLSPAGSWGTSVSVVRAKGCVTWSARTGGAADAPPCAPLPRPFRRSHPRPPDCRPRASLWDSGSTGAAGVHIPAPLCPSSWGGLCGRGGGWGSGTMTPCPRRAAGRWAWARPWDESRAPETSWSSLKCPAAVWAELGHF